MVYSPALLVALAGFASLARGAGPGGYGDGDGYGDAPDPSPSPRPSAAAPKKASPASSSAGGVTGDVQCGPLMCIGATVKQDSIEYVLQSVGSQQVGWMAMGFGTSMVGSPMVIMWPNEDGSVTLSQRKATSRSLPSPDPKPPRVATVNADLTLTSGNQPKFAYTIPNDGNTKPQIIYAFGTDTPSSSNASSAIFMQHLGNGRTGLDLSRTGLNATVLSSPALSLVQSDQAGATGGPSGKSSASKLEMIVLAHASVLAVAFLVIMPAGALLARFYRTFSPIWFKGHWILQFAVAAPLVLTGAILAASIAPAGGPSGGNTHTRVGILLFVLYPLQASLGGIIHFVKPKNFRGRPPQNYIHAVLGLAIIGLAFFQVRTGYTSEWPNAVGRVAPTAINVLWYIWVVFVPVSYALGLLLLRKQYSQERASREAPKQMPWVQKPTYV